MSSKITDTQPGGYRVATKTLLTAAETAQRLHIDRSTVTRRAANPDHPLHIPYAQKLTGLRGGYLFDPDVIDQLAPSSLPEEVPA